MLVAIVFSSYYFIFYLWKQMLSMLTMNPIEQQPLPLFIQRQQIVWISFSDGHTHTLSLSLCFFLKLSSLFVVIIYESDIEALQKNQFLPQCIIDYYIWYEDLSYTIAFICAPPAWALSYIIRRLSEMNGHSDLTFFDTYLWGYIEKVIPYYWYLKLTQNSERMLMMVWSLSMPQKWKCQSQLVTFLFL